MKVMYARSKSESDLFKHKNMLYIEQLNQEKLSDESKTLIISSGNKGALELYFIIKHGL
jgi:hypothetical protein